MNGDFLSASLGSILIFITILLEVIFVYFYSKDRDKRKLMFVIAFAFAAPSYLTWIQPAIEDIKIMRELVLWSPLPIISATLITVLSSFLNWEDFKKPFRAFLIVIGSSIFFALVPLPAEAVLHSILIQGSSVVLIGLLVYLCLKKRERTTLMFLFSMICFTGAGIGWATNVGIEFIFFANAFAIIFIVLVFFNSRGSTTESLSSFFTIREELANAQKKLSIYEEKLRIVGSLTRHDVRNKLSAVTGNVYLAKKMLPVDHAVQEHLSGVETAVEQALSIFDFARTYEKLGVEELGYINVYESFEKAVSLASGLHGITVVDDCRGVEVFADSLLDQIFYNLIHNSLKHGGKVNRIHLYFKEVDESQLRIFYEDDGVGIPEVEKEKIFLEGYGKGTGYGLYLIRKICEVYSWTIQEEGKYGEGVQFIIAIPKVHSTGKLGYKYSEELYMHEMSQISNSRVRSS